MRDFCLYTFYRAALIVIGTLPFRVLFAIGQTAGFCAWLILPKYRCLALHNATIAFGNEKTPREIRRIVRRHFQQLGANILSMIKVGTMPLEKIERHIEIENLDIVHERLRAGRPVVLILSHLGNWELCAQILPKFIGYVRNSTIYQSMENRLMDRHVKKMRGRSGVEMFDRRDGFQKPIELLRGGGALGILSDQHAGDQGLWTPFFGRLASTSPLPALLAKRTGAALVGIAFYTVGPGRWRIVIGPVLEPSPESVGSLTAKVNELIADQVRRAPEDWFWVHNRWKTPRPNFLLSRYKRGVYLPSKMSEPKPFRILIRSSNWLGDSILSTPAVRAIKRGRPDAHVTIAAPAKLASIWKLIPEVDEIISLPNKSLFATVRLLRRQKFDVAILFPNSLRSALEVWLSGIPRRVGYRGHSRAWLLNQIVPPPRKPAPIEHQALHYLRLAEQMGATIEPDGGLQNLTLINGNVQENKIGLCPGAEYGPAKRWLPERFGEAAKEIMTQRPVEWVLFGTAKDSATGEVIATALGEKCVNQIGKTTLDELIEQLRACRLLVTNDTGTMHLAALLGVPIVAIFGSTEPRLTGPLGNHHVILRHQVECSPCFLRECPIDFRCMKAVTVPEVVGAVLSMLKKTDKDTASVRDAVAG